MTIEQLQAQATNTFKTRQLPERLANVATNMHYHIGDHFLNSLDSVGIPTRDIDELRYVFVTGSGPSLLHCVELLKVASKRPDCLIVSGATNAGFLLRNGVTPHVVTIVDTNTILHQVLQTLYRKLSMTLLAVPVWAPPELLNRYEGPIGFFMELLESADTDLQALNNFLVHLLNRSFVSLAFGAFGSSICAQIQTAELYRHLGNHRINATYLCGADFGFADPASTRVPRVQYDEADHAYYEVSHGVPAQLVKDEAGSYTEPIQLLYRLGLMELWRQTQAPLVQVGAGTLSRYLPFRHSELIIKGITNGENYEAEWPIEDIQIECDIHKAAVQKILENCNIHGFI